MEEKCFEESGCVEPPLLEVDDFIGREGGSLTGALRGLGNIGNGGVGPDK